MKFADKKPHEFPRKEVEHKAPVKVDWKLYEPDPDAEVPHGKYKGKTLGWLQVHDERYAAWIYKEGLFGDWGLIKLKESKPQITIDEEETLSTATGKWVGIYEVFPGNGIVSPFL